LGHNSNTSELQPGWLDIPALWSRCKSIGVEPSIDGVGRRGELIRKGLAWETFVARMFTSASASPS
jgi:hypothetical protein